MVYSMHRWTLKEAAYKAVPPHYLARRLTWKSLDLRYPPSGGPILQLSEDMLGKNEEASTEGGLKFLASLSHDAGIVVGVVVAQQGGPT